MDKNRTVGLSVFKFIENVQLRMNISDGDGDGVRASFSPNLNMHNKNFFIFIVVSGKKSTNMHSCTSVLGRRTINPLLCSCSNFLLFAKLEKCLKILRYTTHAKNA